MTRGGPAGLAARAWRAGSSLTAVAALLAPLLLLAAACAAGVVSWEAALEARSVRAWGAAGALVAAAALARAVVERRPAAALGLATALALAAAGLLDHRLRAEVAVDLGEGEAGARWRARAGDGSWAPSDLIVQAIDLEGRTARLALEGREVSAPIGRRVRLDGRRSVLVESAHVAPLFTVARSDGAVEGQGLLKLAPGERDYFQVAVLPHRFYLTRDVPSPGAAAGRLHLRVQRGKLKLVDRDVTLGEAVQFEGLSLTLVEGSRWARLSVRRDPPLAWLVAAPAVAAVAAWTLRRRRGSAAP